MRVECRSLIACSKSYMMGLSTCDTSRNDFNSRSIPGRESRVRARGGLFHLEVGRALLLEGQRAFLGVVRNEHPDADLGVDLEGVVLVHALGLVDGLQDRLNRERTVVV